MKTILLSAALLGLGGPLLAAGPADMLRGMANMADDSVRGVPAPWTFQSWLPVKSAIPGGDAGRGEKLATEGYCYTCHGDKGVAPSRNAPSLAGQDPTYLYKALHDYKSGRLHIDNKSLGMQGIVQPMSDEDMADLASYYSLQTRPASGRRGTPPPASALGCTGCHLANGEPGRGGSGPGLSGMSSGYIKRQIHAFKNGTRNNDVGGMMGGIARNLTDAQIDEIATFYTDQ